MLNSPAFGLVGVGFALAIWVVGGILLGSYLDGRWDTRPVLTLVFLTLGLSLGCYDAYRRLRLVIKSAESKNERKGKP
jgi:F0F1-type ATP synthase assembly protein I